MSKSYLFLFFLITILFSSCVTTNVYENKNTIVFQDEEIVSVETTLVKDGKLKNKTIVDNSSKIENKESENIKVEKINEKITVESKTNGSYMAYYFFGKPFVIIGCTSYELLKSCGYAFINFLGGYNTLTGGDFFWMMPDVKGSIAKAKDYKEQNSIKIYPEYHKKFTDNKITVTKITSEAATMETNENEMTVTSQEEFEYDNTLSVNLSALADAHETFGIVGAVGAIITVPISIGTWILGAAYGVWEKLNED